MIVFQNIYQPYKCIDEPHNMLFSKAMLQQRESFFFFFLWMQTESIATNQFTNSNIPCS